MSFTRSQHVIGSSKPDLTEKVDDHHHGTNKAWLDWFGLVNSKLILQPYHHGTGPW